MKSYKNSKNINSFKALKKVITNNKYVNKINNSRFI